jgi:hypothetical protein
MRAAATRFSGWTETLRVLQCARRLTLPRRVDEDKRRRSGQKWR